VPLWRALLIHFVLRHTVVGRAIYACGGNANAALLAGVDAGKTLFSVYIVAGALVIAVLRNGANLLGVAPFLQMVFSGALILAAVALDQWRRASRV
jgi:simple sugar transport system permease protein